jgi:hypothetical protein
MCKATLAQHPNDGQRREQLIVTEQANGVEVPQIWLQDQKVQFINVSFDILPLPPSPHAQRSEVFLLGIGIEEAADGQPMWGLVLQRSALQV